MEAEELTFKTRIYVDIRSVFGYHCTMKILNLSHIILFLMVIGAMLIHACAPTKEVMVSDSTYILDVEGSQTDVHIQLRMLAEAISTADWLMHYADKNRGKRPVVLVAPIQNATGQRVNSFGMQVEFERLLQNRATITVLAGLALPDTSRIAPSLPVSELLSMGRSHNAEFIVLSELGARAAPGTPHLTNYQLNVELLDVKTHARVWSDVRTIRRIETLSK